MICYHVDKIYYSSAAEERESFYDTGLDVWYAIFDGTEVVREGSPSNFDSVFTEYIEAARTVTPYFNLYINSAIASQSTGSIDLRIVTADTIPEDDIIAFVGIMEDSLPGVDLYGVDFYHVCRSLFSFPVELTYPDSIDTTITFTHNILTDKMKTVVFIQNLDTKEVMQAIINTFEEE